MGGFSAEKVISIKSGTVAMNFLDKNRYNTYAVIIDNEDWRLENNNQSYPIDKLDFSVNINNQKIEFDGVFIAVHFDLAHIASIANFNCFQIHCGRVKLVWN